MKACKILIMITYLQLLAFTPVILANNAATYTVSDEIRCRVCGMFVAKHPNWLAQIHYNDLKETIFFDGVKDMMVFYFNPER